MNAPSVPNNGVFQFSDNPFIYIWLRDVPALFYRHLESGCKHCYAETFAERFRGVKGHPYEQGFDLRLVPGKLAEPLRWRNPKMIFVNSMRSPVS